jgi:ATP synthase protein I
MTEDVGYSTVSKILITQAVVIVLVSVGYFLLGSVDLAISSILGGFIAFLPNLYFAYRISLVKGQSAKVIVRSFYSGESRKVVLTFVLFALVFQIPGVLFFPLMVCFVAVLSVFWFALIMFARDFEIKSVRKDV